MDMKSYQIVLAEGYITVRLIGNCDVNNIGDFEKDLTSYISDPFPHLVVNCEHLTSISKDWIRVLLKMQVDLKQVNRGVRLILLNSALLQVLKREGVDTAFKQAPTLREALVQFGLVTKKMLDTDFINPFLTATLFVLKTQARVSAEPGKIFLKKDGDKFFGDISGVIGIVSDAFNGSVVISFPEKTFLKVVSGMLGEEITKLSSENIDGAGEITNMIFGQAKVVLNEKGYGIKTALPSVVTGKDHAVLALTKGPVVVLPFTSNAGEFFVEICLSG